MAIHQVQQVKFDYEQLRKDIISKRMIDNRMSLSKAAEKIGVSKATLSRVETGSDMKMETFCKILRWLVKSPQQYFKN